MARQTWAPLLASSSSLGNTRYWNIMIVLVCTCVGGNQCFSCTTPQLFYTVTVLLQAGLCNTTSDFSHLSIPTSVILTNFSLNSMIANWCRPYLQLSIYLASWNRKLWWIPVNTWQDQTRNWCSYTTERHFLPDWWKEEYRVSGPWWYCKFDIYCINSLQILFYEFT